MAAHVLEEHLPGTACLDRTQHVRPQVTRVVGACASTGGTERLTGVATAQHVEGRHGVVVPVDSLHVADVRHVRVPGGEQLAGAGVNVGHADELTAGQRGHGEVEAAVSGEQGQHSSGSHG